MALSERNSRVMFILLHERHWRYWTQVTYKSQLLHNMQIRAASLVSCCARANLCFVGPQD